MSVWAELGEVIVVGSIAGVGLAIAFAFTIRGIVHAGTARREGRHRPMLGYALLATAAGSICIIAVLLALYSMLHR